MVIVPRAGTCSTVTGMFAVPPLTVREVQSTTPSQESSWTMIRLYRTGYWVPISISRNIWVTRVSSSACTAEASTPPSRLQVAEMVISSA